MLETTLVALQDITLERIFDDNGRKTLYSEFPQIMQQVESFGIHLKSLDFSLLQKRSTEGITILKENEIICKKNIKKDSISCLIDGKRR